LPRVSIRGNSQQSVRISLHHLQISFFIQIPLGNFLSQKLLSYPRRKRRLTLLGSDGVKSLRFSFVLSLFPILYSISSDCLSLSLALRAYLSTNQHFFHVSLELYT
jgi:hypothetical protein